MLDKIKKLILILILLSHLGSAFGAMSFSENVEKVNGQPCFNHVELISDGANTPALTPCDKHCASTILFLFDLNPFEAQGLASETQDKLTITFNSLAIFINLSPPK